MDAHTIRELAKLRERRDAALELAYRPGTGALRRASALDEAYALALGEAAVIGELAEREREAATRKRADLSAVFADDGLTYVRGRGRVKVRSCTLIDPHEGHVRQTGSWCPGLTDDEDDG